MRGGALLAGKEPQSRLLGVGRRVAHHAGDARPVGRPLTISTAREPTAGGPFDESTLLARR